MLAGGRGSRLMNLTDKRAKPAVHFAGKYRIIDFALSNCLNSGMRRIYVMTQYKSHSLLRHIQRGWNVLRSDANEFIDLLPAQQRVDEAMWYRGTADAVFQNIDILRAEGPDYVIVLAGDHVYRMDYSLMIAEHARSGANVTVGCVEVPRHEARAFGVMAIDEHQRVVSFLEKPDDPPHMPGQPDVSLASMGIYVFDAEFLYEHLSRDAALSQSSHDFGKDLIPYMVERYDVRAHLFGNSAIRNVNGAGPYWRDVGTLDAYWEAHMDLCSVNPQLDLYDKRWPIMTRLEQLPPAKFVFDHEGRRGLALDSLVSHGVIISGGEVRRSVISSEVRVNSFSHITECVILPECDIGRHARLTRCLIDRGCRIPEGMVIGENPHEDAARFYRTANGITLVTPEMLERLGG